jgi:hypothetical protein
MERKFAELSAYKTRGLYDEFLLPGIFEKKVSQFSWCKLLQIILK